MEKAKVYYSKEITPEKLIEIYEKLGKKGIINAIKSAKKFDEIDLLI